MVRMRSGPIQKQDDGATKGLVGQKTLPDLCIGGLPRFAKYDRMARHRCVRRL
jgi:hypothetical protein